MSNSSFMVKSCSVISAFGLWHCAAANLNANSVQLMKSRIFLFLPFMAERSSQMCDCKTLCILTNQLLKHNQRYGKLITDLYFVMEIRQPITEALSPPMKNESRALYVTRYESFFRIFNGNKTVGVDEIPIKVF